MLFVPQSVLGHSYRYRGRELIVTVKADRPGDALVRWRALAISGKPNGRWHRQIRALTAGEQEIKLQVGRAPGHMVVIRTAKRKTLELWANRGTWYTGSKTGGAALPIMARVPQHMTHPADIVIAPGARRTGDRKIAGGATLLGRTLGFERGRGIRPAAGHALVLVLSGAPAALMLSLTERLPSGALHYWDYPLALTRKPRRLVLPLSLFRSRTGARNVSRPRTVHSLSLRLLGTDSPEEITCAYVALTPIWRRARLLTDHRVRIYGSRGLKTTLWQQIPKNPAAGMIAKARATQIADRRAISNIRVGPGTERFWLCYRDERRSDGRDLGCDPPDAPASAYTMIWPGRAFTLDDFSSQGPMNRFRRAGRFFASDSETRAKMHMRWNGRSLSIGLPSSPPEATSDETAARGPAGHLETVATPNAARYIGYFSPSPHPMNDRKGSWMVSLRSGRMRDIEVGLRQPSGIEAKVALRDYLGNTPSSEPSSAPWVRVRIPSQAFEAIGFAAKRAQKRRKLNAIEFGVSITMPAPLGSAHRLELDEIRWVPQTTPIALATFDGRGAHGAVVIGQSSLGGAITSESKFRALIEAQIIPGGQQKSGLKVRISRVMGQAYGLVSIGLRRLDLRAYDALSFFVRGARGGEGVNMYLRDRRGRRAKASLPALAAVSATWRRITIPLARFRPKIDLGETKALILAWEDRLIADDTLYFDTITAHRLPEKT